jgi:hypothetical protein
VRTTFSRTLRRYVRRAAQIYTTLRANTRAACCDFIVLIHQALEFILTRRIMAASEVKPFKH